MSNDLLLCLEEIAALNLAKFRKVQTELGEFDETSREE